VNRPTAIMATLAALGAVITGSAAHASAHAAPAHAAPAAALHTLTVTATDVTGKPDNGDLLWAYDADNMASFSSEGASVFSNGVAKLSVPTGHYWVVSQFFDFSSSPPAAQYIDVLPQVTVSADTTVHVAAKAATSQITMATPRPAVPQGVRFTLVFGDRNGSTRGLQFIENNPSQSKALWVSPVARKPAVGTLRAFAGALLSSPPGKGTPYAYNLDLKDPAGIIPVQHYKVQASSLATVTERYYEDVSSDGIWATAGGYAPELTLANLPTTTLFGRSLPLPGTQVQYFSAAPGLYWKNLYYESNTDASLEQFDDVWHVLSPGQHQVVEWNRYPLHPQPFYSAGGPGANLFPLQVSASRAGDTLNLNVSPFSDNQPGHLGGNFEVGLTASYAIDQNGKQIAQGNWAAGIAPVTLSKSPSVIRFTLNAARTGTDPAYQLSPSSQTTWTWRSSRPQPSTTVPAPWYCFATPAGQLQHHCAAQPMMTLNYQVRGMTLHGTVPTGPQLIDLGVAQIQLAPASRITSAAAQVSCDDGQTWQEAKVTSKGGGNFGIAFTEPAGCAVTLRVRAADSAGDSIAETITRGYEIGAGLVRG
jgi:hypothetical protein